jgi:hypothetical protein
VPLFFRLLFVVCLVLSSPSLSHAEPSSLPSPPLRTAFGSRCAKSPIPCNRIDYFTAHFHIADVILLPSTDSRGFRSDRLIRRFDVAVSSRRDRNRRDALAVESAQAGIEIQNGPALLNVKGILFPLLRNPVPDSEFTFGLQLQQQLRIPNFEGLNDLGTKTPLTVLRAVADKPFWRMGITASLGFLLTPGTNRQRTFDGAAHSFAVDVSRHGARIRSPARSVRIETECSAARRIRSVCSLRVGQRNVAQRRLHARSWRWNRTERDLHRWPDYHIGRETVEQSYSRPPIPNREMVPSPWPWLWEKLKQEWNEAELANEAHRRGEDWLTDECFLYEEGKYDKPLRHLGKRDASGKFCNVGGSLSRWMRRCGKSGRIWFRCGAPLQNAETPKLPLSPGDRRHVQAYGADSCGASARSLVTDMGSANRSRQRRLVCRLQRLRCRRNQLRRRFRKRFLSDSQTNRVRALVSRRGSLRAALARESATKPRTCIATQPSCRSA